MRIGKGVFVLVAPGAAGFVGDGGGRGSEMAREKGDCSREAEFGADG